MKTNNWKSARLQDLVSLQRGYDLPAREQRKGSIPIIGSQGTLGYHDISKAQAPGVCVGRSGSAGSVYYVTHDFWPHNTVLYVTDFHSNDPRYCFYFLTSLDLPSFNAGSAVPTLNRNHIHKLPIVIPPIADQRSISNTLGALDDKMELNDELNKTLELIAQLIFRHWFVDFQFPNEKGKPYKSSGGKMKHSELGDVPKDWEMKSILEISEIIQGGTPRRAESRYWNGNLKWASARDISDSKGFYLLETAETISQEGLNNSSTHMLPMDATVITARGTVGQIRLIGTEMTFNQTSYGVVYKGKSGSFFLFLALKNKIDQIENLSYGTIFDTITTRTFDQLRLAVPPQEILEKFNEFVTPLFQLMISNERQNVILKKTRGLVLPKLVSGQIRIRLTAGK